MNAASCICAFVLLYGNERILVRAEPNFLAVLDGRLPAGIRMRGMQMVVVVRVAALSQGAPRQDRLTIHRLDARKIERNGVKRGEHAHIRHHRPGRDKGR